MRLTVLLFASYADALGSSSIELEVPDVASAGDVVAAVRSRASTKLPSPMVAINQAYARLADRVNPGDEVALIPPVAGG